MPVYIFHRTVIEKYRIKANDTKGARLFVESNFKGIPPVIMAVPYFELMGTEEEPVMKDYMQLVEEQKEIVKTAEDTLNKALSTLADYEHKAADEELALLLKEIDEADREAQNG